MTVWRSIFSCMMRRGERCHNKPSSLEDNGCNNTTTTATATVTPQSLCHTSGDIQLSVPAVELQSTHSQSNIHTSNVSDNATSVVECTNTQSTHKIAVSNVISGVHDGKNVLTTPRNILSSRDDDEDDDDDDEEEDNTLNEPVSQSDYCAHSRITHNNVTSRVCMKLHKHHYDSVIHSHTSSSSPSSSYALNDDDDDDDGVSNTSFSQSLRCGVLLPLLNETVIEKMASVLSPSSSYNEHCQSSLSLHTSTSSHRSQSQSNPSLSLKQVVYVYGAASTGKSYVAAQCLRRIVQQRLAKHTSNDHCSYVYRTVQAQELSDIIAINDDIGCCLHNIGVATACLDSPSLTSSIQTTRESSSSSSSSSLANSNSNSDTHTHYVTLLIDAYHHSHHDKMLRHILRTSYYHHNHHTDSTQTNTSACLAGISVLIMSQYTPPAWLNAYTVRVPCISVSDFTSLFEWHHIETTCIKAAASRFSSGMSVGIMLDTIAALSTRSRSHSVTSDVFKVCSYHHHHHHHHHPHSYRGEVVSVPATTTSPPKSHSLKHIKQYMNQQHYIPNKHTRNIIDDDKFAIQMYLSGQTSHAISFNQLSIQQRKLCYVLSLFDPTGIPSSVVIASATTLSQHAMNTAIDAQYQYDIECIEDATTHNDEENRDKSLPQQRQETAEHLVCALCAARILLQLSSHVFMMPPHIHALVTHQLNERQIMTSSGSHQQTTSLLHTHNNNNNNNNKQCSSGETECVNHIGRINVGRGDAGNDDGVIQFDQDVSAVAASVVHELCAHTLRCLTEANASSALSHCSTMTHTDKTHSNSISNEARRLMHHAEYVADRMSMSLVLSLSSRCSSPSRSRSPSFTGSQRTHSISLSDDTADGVPFAQCASLVSVLHCLALLALHCERTDTALNSLRTCLRLLSSCSIDSDKEQDARAQVMCCVRTLHCLSSVYGGLGDAIKQRHALATATIIESSAHTNVSSWKASANEASHMMARHYNGL